MTGRHLSIILVLLALQARAQGDAGVKFMAMNIEDVRASQVEQVSDLRLARAAAIIQHLRPDVLLLNEVAYESDAEAGANVAHNFVEHYLGTPMGGDLEAIQYQVFVAPSNTGMPSGFDLDNDGKVGKPGQGRDYAGDCLGWGTFPGQYAMALLVRPGIEIDRANVRTFREFLWKDLPGASLPTDPATGRSWYSDEELAVLPLSSKSHWDVPLVMPNGQRVHMLCSHPTPPVFDGAEDRNGKRNHDEIKFWNLYVNGAFSPTDDEGVAEPFDAKALFVIAGDLNADPERGDSFNNPARRFLLDEPRIASDPAPTSVQRVERGTPTTTSSFGLRTDYVLPKADPRWEIASNGVWRGPADSRAGDGALPKVIEMLGDRGVEFPSDHFPVWVEMRFVPDP
ncbi:MAG: endonuclease/exonuclease/phosphatase family protein [Planctomycetota bacterium]